jgi:hypothetical protein
MMAEEFVSALRRRDPVAGYLLPIKAHDTLACGVCGVAILLLEVPAGAVRPTCCGRPMRTVCPAPCSAKRPRGADAGTLGGYCYADEPHGLVVRCTRGGRGVVCCDNRPMTLLTR